MRDYVSSQAQLRTAGSTGLFEVGGGRGWRLLGGEALEYRYQIALRGNSQQRLRQPREWAGSTPRRPHRARVQYQRDHLVGGPEAPFERLVVLRAQAVGGGLADLGGDPQAHHHRCASRAGARAARRALRRRAARTSRGMLRQLNVPRYGSKIHFGPGSVLLDSAFGTALKCFIA